MCVALQLEDAHSKHACWVGAVRRTKACTQRNVDPHSNSVLGVVREEQRLALRPRARAALAAWIGKLWDRREAVPAARSNHSFHVRVHVLGQCRFSLETMDA